MEEAKEMLLADAIETAIESEKERIKQRHTIAFLVFADAMLLGGIIALYLVGGLL